VKAQLTLDIYQRVLDGRRLPGAPFEPLEQQKQAARAA
jgi:hypothetical protein